MHRVIHSESVKAALAAKGWDQKKLAEVVGVSGQAVTHWMKGMDFPRPAALLKIASALALGLDQLVRVNPAEQSVIAFRKKGGAKTTDASAFLSSNLRERWTMPSAGFHSCC